MQIKQHQLKAILLLAIQHNELTGNSTLDIYDCNEQGYTPSEELEELRIALAECEQLEDGIYKLFDITASPDDIYSIINETELSQRNDRGPLGQPTE